MVDLDDGRLAVQIARAAVGRAVGARGASGPPAVLPPAFRERRGVFVSWYATPGHDLRGCVGYPRPVLPLADGVRDAAVAAAIEDPRFPAVGPEELTGLVAEVSVLTPFEAVPLAQRPRAVRVGRDGLSVESSSYRGLLLPQVAVEQEWNAEQFLDGTCVKAGLRPRAWTSASVAVFRFQAEVYRELRPGGDVVRASELE